MPAFRRGLLLAGLSLGLALAACDRDVTDPALRDDDVDALLARAGLSSAAGDYTLSTLLHDAIRTVQREQGTEAARLQLERVREAGGARSPTDSTTRRQLAIVLEALGPGVVDRAREETHARLARLALALDSLSAPDAGPLRRRHALGEAELAAASVASDPVAALLRVTRAAENAAELRRTLIARQHVEALPELFRQAQARLATAGEGTPEPLRRHAELLEAARVRLLQGHRAETHRALEAVRAEELRLTIATLGPETAARVVDGVALGLERLEPLTRTARLRRMHGTARDLMVRAEREVERGRPEAALDLASHAAGLTNALMQAVALR